MSWRLVTALAVAVALLPASASASTIPVADAKALSVALTRAHGGDTIQLANGVFAQLNVTKQASGGVIHIVGSGSTAIQGMKISGAANLSFENLTVTPAGANKAKVDVLRSNSVAFRHVLFDGVSEDTGTELDVASSTRGVLIADSEFTQCRANRACLLAHGSGITVQRTIFHDCFDCDMVRGSGSGVSIVGSSFDRALRGTHGNHNDLIQIMGGGPWTIVGNRFGVRQGGAAQIFVSPGIRNRSNAIHDVTIMSNIFTGKMGFALQVAGGQKSGIGPPSNVRIVNNTILSGSQSAVRLSDSFGSLEPAKRPLVANNIFGVSNGGLCRQARMSKNLVEKGRPCEGDRQGAAKLGADGVPTRQSVLVINGGDRRFAPPKDFFGKSRLGAPDLGAVEFRP